jgi:prepilin peptidase CpaA
MARLAPSAAFRSSESELEQANLEVATMLQAMMLLFFPALMIFAAFSDLFTMTISNVVSIILIGSFFLLAVLFDLSLAEIGLHIACGFGVLVVTFFFFTRGWIGGGDAKLASATALWLGFDKLLDYSLYAALMGGALTVALLMLRKWPLPSVLTTRQWIVRLHDNGSGVPYGIALAIAGLILYPESTIWLSAISH